VFIGTQFNDLFKFTTTDSHVEKEVILNRIDKVFKLVTVEGHYSELYRMQESKNFKLISFSEFIPALQKKAIIRVSGKASVGYDLERLKIEVNEERRQVTINKIPEPEVLSIEHDLDYYDVYEGIYNKFSEADFNRMNADAKEVIRKAADEGNLKQAAAEQMQDLLEYLRFMVEKDGWVLKISDQDQYSNPTMPD
jgi:hypothetical protein